MPTAIDNSNIKDAVDLWYSDQYQCITTYGTMSAWNVTNVTDVYAKRVFNGRTNIPDLSGWDTSNIRIMHDMFYGADTTGINIGNWDTSSCVNMENMFYGADLTGLGTLSWDVSKVTHTTRMFDCQDLGWIGDEPFGSANNAAWQAKLLKWGGGVDLSLWKDDKRPASLVNSQYMFYQAFGFNSELPWGIMPNLRNCSSMFNSAQRFNNGDSGNNYAKPFNWSQFGRDGINGMFAFCHAFNQDLYSVSNTINSHNDLNHAFKQCRLLTFRFDNLWVVSGSNKNLQNMFAGCNALASIYSGNSNYNNGNPNMAFFTGTTAVSIAAGAERVSAAAAALPAAVAATSVKGNVAFTSKLTSVGITSPGPITTATDVSSDANVDYRATITLPGATLSSITDKPGLIAVVTTLYAAAYGVDENRLLVTLSAGSVVINIDLLTDGYYTPTCFPAGTPVQTDQGVTAIEQLVPGEHTLRGKSIIAITQTRPLQKHIVCFEKDSIGKNVPSQQTLCSKEHKVLYQGEMIKARDLADMCKNVKKVSYNGETLYNVLLEKHGKMLVNNMICETLHPENIAAKFAKAKSYVKRNVFNM